MLVTVDVTSCTAVVVFGFGVTVVEGTITVTRTAVKVVAFTVVALGRELTDDGPYLVWHTLLE